MGTNFYWIKKQIEKSEIKNYFDVVIKQDKKYFAKDYYNDIEDEYIYHIGKRSSAGLYCSKCHITPCEAGTSGVHHSIYKFSNVCPVCGEDLSNTHICSFTWYDYNRDRYLLDHFKDSDIKMIEDENGDKFTVKEFLEKELGNSKIYYFSKELFS